MFLNIKKPPVKEAPNAEPWLHSHKPAKSKASWSAGLSFLHFPLSS